MTRQETPPEYFEHLCIMVKAVFAAELTCKRRDNITDKFNSGEMTADEYIEAVAEELLSKTEKEELLQ